MTKLVIKRGRDIIVDTNKDNLINANQTSDGIVFMFKNGFLVTYTDTSMPISTKDLIVSSTNNFPLANLEVDVLNYKTPVTAKI